MKKTIAGGVWPVAGDLRPSGNSGFDKVAYGQL